MISFKLYYEGMQDKVKKLSIPGKPAVDSQKVDNPAAAWKEFKPKNPEDRRDAWEAEKFAMIKKRQERAARLKKQRNPEDKRLLPDEAAREHGMRHLKSAASRDPNHYEVEAARKYFELQGIDQPEWLQQKGRKKPWEKGSTWEKKHSGFPTMDDIEQRHKKPNPLQPIEGDAKKVK